MAFIGRKSFLHERVNWSLFFIWHLVFCIIKHIYLNKQHFFSCNIAPHNLLLSRIQVNQRNAIVKTMQISVTLC